MDTLFSFDKIITRFRTLINSKMTGNYYAARYSECLRKENKAHKEFKKLTKEIHEVLSDANNIVTKEKLKTDILVRYKNVFSSLYNQTEIE